MTSFRYYGTPYWHCNEAWTLVVCYNETIWQKRDSTEWNQKGDALQRPTTASCLFKFHPFTSQTDIVNSECYCLFFPPLLMFMLKPESCLLYFPLGDVKTGLHGIASMGLRPVQQLIFSSNVVPVDTGNSHCSRIQTRQSGPPRWHSQKHGKLQERCHK